MGNIIGLVIINIYYVTNYVAHKKTEEESVKFTITKKEAVDKYGNSKQKDHFYKYKKFKNKSIEDSLIKEIERYYEHVSKIKQGRSIVYELDNKRSEIIPKEDNRISNGSWSNPYIKNMDIIVVSKLEQGSILPEAKTLSTWLLEFGLINQSMYDLLISANNNRIKIEHEEALINSNIICKGEEKILDDFRDDVKYLQGQLAATLERMRKANIIEFYMIPKAVLTNGEVVTLDEITFHKLITLRKELMEKHEVDEWTVKTLKNAEKVKSFNKELIEKFKNIETMLYEKISVQFYYKTYSVILKARKQRIIKYLEKYSKEAIEQFKKDKDNFLNSNNLDYKTNRENFVYTKAKEREENFIGDTVETEDLKQPPNGLYGEEFLDQFQRYKKVNYAFNSGYYDLYFNRKYAETIKSLQNYYGHEFGKTI